MWAAPAVVGGAPTSMGGVSAAVGGASVTDRHFTKIVSSFLIMNYLLQNSAKQWIYVSVAAIG